MKYFGFDLGDGESCIAWSRALGTHAPQPIPINGELSFVTAVGKFNGRTVIGSHAANNAEVTDLQVCFKRDFLHNLPHVNQALEDFVRGVLECMRMDPELAEIIDDPEEACFVVGCPAGWKLEDRERYRELLKKAGMKNVRLASESRAAYEYALRSHADGVHAGMPSDSVLVADIGSSTLDFAFVVEDQEMNVSVAGDTHLGGGLLDEMIVIYSLQVLLEKDEATALKIAAVLEKSPSWRSRVMLRARELKEQYFTNEEYYQQQGEPLTEPVKIFQAGKPLVLPLSISTEIVEEHLISQPHPSLENHSFRSRLANNLISVRQNVAQKLKELAEQQGQDKHGKLQMLILTGGASRMSFFRQMCHKEFVGVPMVVSDEPEFDIARGLAYAGSVDESAAQLIREIRSYISGSAAETAVSEQLPALARGIAHALGEVLMENCVKPMVQSWKRGTIVTLSNFETAVNTSIEGYMTSKRAEAVMRSAIDPWSEELMKRIQADLDEIARKYRVNLGSMQLNGLLVSGAGAGDVKMVSAFMTTIQALVTVITTVVCGMICGGAGVALLSSLGPAAPFVGAIIGFLTALKGTQYAKEKVMNVDLPLPVRMLMPTKLICSNLTRQKIINGISDSIQNSPEMNDKLVKQIAGIIDDAITETLQQCEVRFVA